MNITYEEFHKDFVKNEVIPRMKDLSEKGYPVSDDLFIPKDCIIHLTRSLFGGNVNHNESIELIDGMVREGKSDRDPVEWFWKHFFKKLE